MERRDLGGVGAPSLEGIREFSWPGEFLRELLRKCKPAPSGLWPPAWPCGLLLLCPSPV